MDVVFVEQFRSGGAWVAGLLALLSVLAVLLGAANTVSRRAVAPVAAARTLAAALLIQTAGFFLIGWLHYRIYSHLPLELPANLAAWINRQLGVMNSQAAYAFPLYDPAAPPRYAIPLWIENEKYYFWFMAYSFMAWSACVRIGNHRIKGALLLLLGLQNLVMYFFANPFAEPLPRFFAEIGPWFSGRLGPMERLEAFMRLYPRMIFYYNASYMWLHPPMLFLAYACITVTFVTSVSMLIRRRPEIETLGYDYAKFGYFMLTLGMLLGYPWALQAWGPNWWWDPKICSSIMMWAIYSTYLHTRLYANKRSMWYFTSFLGILCFVSMIFTFITSFYFPGEHTFQ